MTTTKKSKPNIIGREFDDFRDRVLGVLGKEGPVTKDTNEPVGNFDHVKLYKTVPAENSDKVYEIQIVEESKNNYAVKFQYGRRNGTMNKGMKGTNLTLDRARIMLRKLVAEKKADQYTENPDGHTQQ